jgi:hypothetical protein
MLCALSGTPGLAKETTSCHKMVPAALYKPVSVIAVLCSFMSNGACRVRYETLSRCFTKQGLTNCYIDSFQDSVTEQCKEAKSNRHLSLKPDANGHAHTAILRLLVMLTFSH